MKKTPLLFEKAEATISTADLEYHARNWLFECDFRGLSKTTLAIRRFVVDKLLWFLRSRELPRCGKSELQQFLSYVRNGHEDEQGRWGNAQMRRAVRPATTATYFTILRTLFRFLVTEGAIETSPLETMARPVARPDQIQPFTQEQIGRLRAAARRSRHPRRDEAILLFLLDTGVRASELCSLQLSDVDLQGKRCRVLGKGNKHRYVYFGKDTARALWQYLKEGARDRSDDGPLFQSDRGMGAGEALSRSGLLQLIERLGIAAKIEATRCSPHTFRHTFAVEFLRAGGNVFSLKELLGHTSLTIVNRYIALAQADLERQHRQFSPVDNLKGRAAK